MAFESPQALSAPSAPRKRIHLDLAALLELDRKFHRRLSAPAHHAEARKTLSQTLLRECEFELPNPAEGLPETAELGAATSGEFSTVHARIRRALKVEFQDELMAGKTVRALVAPDAESDPATFAIYKEFFQVLEIEKSCGGQRRLLSAEREQCLNSLQKIEEETKVLEEKEREWLVRIEEKRVQARKHWEAKVEALRRELVSVQSLLTTCRSGSAALRQRIAALEASLADLATGESQALGHFLPRLMEACRQSGMPATLDGLAKLDYPPCTELPEELRLRLEGEYERWTTLPIEFYIPTLPRRKPRWRPFALAGAACAVGGTIWMFWPAGGFGSGPEAMASPPSETGRLRKTVVMPDYVPADHSGDGVAAYRAPSDQIVRFEMGALAMNVGPDPSGLLVRGRYRAVAPGSAWQKVTWRETQGGAVRPVFQAPQAGQYLLKMSLEDLAGNATHSWFELAVAEVQGKAFYAMQQLDAKQIGLWQRGFSQAPWLAPVIVPSAAYSIAVESLGQEVKTEFKYRDLTGEEIPWMRLNTYIHQFGKGMLEISPSFPEQEKVGEVLVRLTVTQVGVTSLEREFQYKVGPGKQAEFVKCLDDF